MIRDLGEIQHLYISIKNCQNSKQGQFILIQQIKEKKLDEDIEKIDYECDYCNYQGNSIKQIEYHIANNHEYEDQEYQLNGMNVYDRYGVKTRKVPQVNMFDLQATNKSDEK